MIALQVRIVNVDIVTRCSCTSLSTKTFFTGHTSRVDRKSLTDYNPFDSKEYSKEELIAEIGAAFLCGTAGIKNETIDNSASYIQSWLNVLKDRKNVKMIVIAAGQAQKAVDYITKDSYEPDLIHF